MTTIIERDVSPSGDTASTAITAIIGIVVLLLVGGAILYAMQLYPFNNRAPQDTSGGFINVDVNGGMPSGTASSY